MMKWMSRTWWSWKRLLSVSYLSPNIFLFFLDPTKAQMASGNWGRLEIVWLVDHRWSSDTGSLTLLSIVNAGTPQIVMRELFTNCKASKSDNNKIWMQKLVTTRRDDLALFFRPNPISRWRSVSGGHWTQINFSSCEISIFSNSKRNRKRERERERKEIKRLEWLTHGTLNALHSSPEKVVRTAACKFMHD